LEEVDPDADADAEQGEEREAGDGEYVLDARTLVVA
jgi:hypothetical protein